MASLVDLYARPGAGAVLTLWRIGVTNADSTVVLTIDPDITGATATAFTDSSGDDQGRIDIEIPTDAAAGAHTWSAEIDGEVVWTGGVYIGVHGRPESFLAHSRDIRSETDPPWLIPRPEDVEGTSPGGSGVPDGGTTGQVLTKQSDADDDADWETPASGAGLPAGGTTGQFLAKASDDDYDAEWIDAAGVGDVTAAAAFAVDNRLITSDGTDKGIKASGVTVNGAAVSGVSTLTTTGLITGGAGASITGNIAVTGTVDNRDVSADGTALDTVVAAFGAATLDTWVPGTAGAGQFPRRNAGDTAFEWATITAATVGADPTGTATSTVAAHAAAADPHVGYQLESEKGAPNGYASLGADGNVVEPATSITDGISTFTFDALTDTQILYVDGGVIKSKNGTGGGATSFTDLDDVPSVYTGAAGLPAIVNATEDGLEFAALNAADVGADPSGTASSSMASHVAAGDPHTGYQLESEKNAVNGYAGLDASGYVTPAVKSLRSTGGSAATLNMGTVNDLQLMRRSGTDFVGVAYPQQHFVGNDIPSSGLGNDGDTYERVLNGVFYVKSGGAWVRSSLYAPPMSMVGAEFWATPRYGNGNLSNPNMVSPTVTAAAQVGATYATTNARTSQFRIAYNGNSTANTTAAGIILNEQGKFNTAAASRHGRLYMEMRFGFANVTQSNFRFFAGFITTGGTFSDDPTGASSVLGDRVGLAVDANTSLAAKWLVNYSGANQLNSAAHTLVQDNWYVLKIWNVPLSNVIYMELQEQSAANGAMSVVASTSFATTSDIVDMACRPFMAVANAGTAASSANLHFGGIAGRMFYTF